MNIDKVADIIRQKVTEEEAKQFFNYGPTGLTLFETVDNIAEYPTDIDTPEKYADALIENMRELINGDEVEQAQKECDEAWAKLEEEVKE